MSEIKEFAHDARGYVLMGDSRDIAVPYSKRSEVWDWCQENDVYVEYQGSLGGTDLWRVVNEKQRLLFVLRWSS